MTDSIDDKSASPQPTAANVDAFVRQARHACQILQESLPQDEISVRALNVWSKAPFQLLCVREALIWRLEELARGACDGLERGDLASAALLTRGVAESVALTWKLLGLLKERDKHAAGELNDLLMRALSGASNWKEMPKPYHVMDLVRDLDKKVPGFLSTYDILSEIVHPNGRGVFGLFGTIDKMRYTASFGRNPDKTFVTRGQIAEALLGAIGLFEHAYNGIADELPKFLEELDKIWPEEPEGNSTVR